MQNDSKVSSNTKIISFFQQNLLRWYSKFGRDLPWRHTSDPYHILISEIMLHQTQVDRVLPKYLQWIQTYPSFQALASASILEVQELWKPLGYNFRPIRLHKIAQRVINEFNGRLPNTIEELTAIKGIGRYTAGAILSFAFHKDAPIVDTNIRRVIQRIFDIKGNLLRASAKKQIWSLAEKLIPTGQANIFNQAIMDFGALICMARNPSCHICFIKAYCRFHLRTREDFRRP